MTKAGERLIGGMKEAIAIANGEQPAASITVNGQTYVPVEAVQEAVTRERDRIFRAPKAEGEWTEATKLLVQRFEIAGAGFGYAVHNSDGSAAIAKLMKTMAMKLDGAIAAIQQPARADTEEGGR